MNTTQKRLTGASLEHCLRIKCVTGTPVHVGSGESSGLTDSDLRRNSKGQIVVPGTSIAGVVRTAIERMAGVHSGENRCQFYQTAKHTSPCKCGVCKLMGNVSPVGNDSSVTQSKVTFDDVVIAGANERIVDSVAIDRDRSAASDAKKFDYAQILPGAELEIVIRAKKLCETELDWLEAAVRLLAEGQIRIGAKTNRGLGKLAPQDNGMACRVYQRDVGSIDTLIALAIGSNSDHASWTEIKSKLDQFTKTNQAVNQICFELETDRSSGFLVADPVQSARTGFDHAPRKLNGLTELPASSLIGALRSGCERIIRTVVPIAGCRLFTGSGTGKKEVCSCVVCQVFGNTESASKVLADVTTIANGYSLPMDHVAIDRFTGGASDRKKFDAIICRDAKFHVQLSFDPGVNSHDAKWMVGLLVLAVRDLNQGIIRLGSGRSKGYGKMNVQGDQLNWSGEEFVETSRDLPGSVDSLWAHVDQHKSTADTKIANAEAAS